MSTIAEIGGRSHAPWSRDEVASLNAYQASGVMHPFTGYARGLDGEDTILIATPRGWVEREEGPVVQRWAHSFMVNWDWKKMGIGAAP